MIALRGGKVGRIYSIWDLDNRLETGADMEYTVVQKHNREELIRKVAELIKQGWKPLGGIAVSTVAPVLGNYIFCQAMIKERT